MAQELSPLQKKEINFTNRQLVALIWPLMLEQLLSITVGLADSLMVSTVGDASISAVSLVDSISNLMIYIFSAMSAGGAAVAGQYIGKRAQGDACRAGQQLIALLAIVSTSFVALLYIFKNAVLTTLYGQIAPEVMRAVNTYYSIVIASIPAIALYNGGAALFRTMSKSSMSLRVSLLMNSINVTGNAVLIFGFHMDVAGVAIPTLVSRWVAAIVILACLFNPKLMLHLGDVRSFRIDGRIMKNIVYIGAPSGAENGMFQLGKLVLVSMVSTLGTASITANAIGNTFSNFHCFTGQAINLGMTTVVSQCIGAGEFDKARYYFKKLLKATYASLAVANLTFLALLPTIMRIYNVSPDAEKLAVTVAVIHSLASIVLWPTSFATTGFLRATGDARYTMVVSMTSMWLVRVLFAYILAKPLHYGVVGVWVAHSVMDWIVRSAIFIHRYRSGKWMTKGIKD